MKSTIKRVLTMTYEELLEAVKKLPPMTPEEKRAQTISFAYGNVAMHNPAITKEMVAAQYDLLHPKEEAT